MIVPPRTSTTIAEPPEIGVAWLPSTWFCCALICRRFTLRSLAFCEPSCSVITSPSPRCEAMSAICAAAMPAKYRRGTRLVGRSISRMSDSTSATSSASPRKTRALLAGSAVRRAAKLSSESLDPSATFSAFRCGTRTPPEVLPNKSTSRCRAAGAATCSSSMMKRACAEYRLSSASTICSTCRIFRGLPVATITLNSST